MTDLPDMKIKAVPVFPATTTGGDGIDVVREGGEYTIDLDYADFAPPASGLVDPGNETLLIWNVVTGTYTLAPVSLFGAGGGVPEAPTDGVVYGRKDANWEVIPDAGLGSAYPSNEVPTMDSTAAPGVSALYSRGDHVHPSDATKANLAQVVRYDTVQALTEAQDAQARSNVFAAPFDALAYNGMQINGSMEVSQENGSSGVVVLGTSKYILDGWAVETVGAQSINAGATASGTPSAFSSRLSILTGIANASPSAGEYCSTQQVIEGYRTSRLGFGTANAQSITISFWVNTFRTGMFSGAVRNGTANRSYAFTFTINVAGTWEYKTVTIPGDTTGTWSTGNGGGLVISFALMCGATFATAPNVWTAGNFIAATGTTNGVASVSDYMLLTGVVVLPGIEAPSAERSSLIMRPYDQELLTCQRYYAKTYPAEFSPASTGSSINGAIIDYAGLSFAGRPFLTWRYPVRMRATPTVPCISPVTGVFGAAANLNTGVDVAVTTFAVSDTSFSSNMAGAATAGHAFAIHYYADVRL